MSLGKSAIEDRLQEAQRKLVLASFLDAPAMAVIGLALFAKFSHNPASLHPLLANAGVVNAALAIAIPWAAVCAYWSIRQSMLVARLKNQLPE